MSLERLINAVAEELNINTSAALDKMSTFVEIVGYSSFTEWTLRGDFLKSEVQKVVECIDNSGYLDRTYHYYCPYDNSEAFTSFDNTECDMCEGYIDDENHEVTEMYAINERLLDLIRKECHKREVEHYLNNAYRKNLNFLLNDRSEIIPFLGSGISMPLGLPNWQGLLEKLNDNSFSSKHLEEEFNILVNNGDLLSAFEYLIENSYEYSNYDQIKNRIIEIFTEMRIKQLSETEHNYIDFVSLNSNFYLTTNYDLFMSEFLSYENNEYTAPICLSEIINIRKLMSGKNQVIHLHGHLNKKDSMIVSKEDYQKLYENDDLMLRFGSIMNNKPMLFAGFSFTDDFFEELYQKIITFVSSQHYIIIPNADDETVRKFNQKNIKVISLNVRKDLEGRLDNKDFVKAIKVLIAFLE